jgi:hypothetical protein
MGIDVHLIWDGMTDDDRKKQTFIDLQESARRADELRQFADSGGVITTQMMMAVQAGTSFKARGMAGYIREGYGISPHPCAILVREAFDAPDRTAVEIPAAVMRERLHSVTEPADCAVGRAASNLWQFMADTAPPDVEWGPVSEWAPTRPATVWECVQERCANAAHVGGTATADEMMLNYTAFVELAERLEREHGHPCRVVVDA